MCAFVLERYVLPRSVPIGWLRSDDLTKASAPRSVVLKSAEKWNSRLQPEAGIEIENRGKMIDFPINRKVRSRLKKSKNRSKSIDLTQIGSRSPISTLLAHDTTMIAYCHIVYRKNLFHCMQWTKIASAALAIKNHCIGREIACNHCIQPPLTVNVIAKISLQAMVISIACNLLQPVQT